MRRLKSPTDRRSHALRLSEKGAVTLAVFLLGIVSTLFFGLLPLYLPELFPTHARSTGAGVSFNFGK